MTRGGRKASDEGPERRCIVTGESAPKGALLRFVRSPDGVLTPDLLGRLPGRGLYLWPEPKHLEKALAKGLFARAAEAPVTAPEGLALLIESQMARRICDLLSLARKAGEAVCGFEKVKDWLTKGQARVLIQAFDGSERGKTKLHPPEGKNAFIGCLSAQELGLSFGREHAIHAALSAGGITERVVEEAAKLALWRGRAVKPARQTGRGRDEGKWSDDG